LDDLQVKRWFETRTLDYPKHVVSGRFGASIMFVAYDRWRQQWFWVYPGGEERIAEPTHIFVDEEWAREHLLKTPRAKLDKAVKLRRKKGEQQLALDL
jgi:hypothetical protein